MIYYSEGSNKLLPQDVVVLQHVEGEGDDALKGHIILSRDMYERLVLLQNKYCDNYLLVERKVGAKNQPDAVNYFVKHAPAPVSMLAPFLHLIKTEEKLPLDVGALCGYLHVISMSIEFDMYLGVSEEIRKSVQFSYRQVSGYVGLWKDLEARVKLAEIDEDTVTKDFIRTLVVEVTKGILGEVIEEVRELARTVVQPAQAGGVMQPVPVVSQETVDSDEVEENEDMGSLLKELLADELDMIANENAEKEEEEEEAVFVEEEKTNGAEVSVIDNIIAMYGGN